VHGECKARDAGVRAIELEVGHFNQRWHSHVHGHDQCDHSVAPAPVSAPAAAATATAPAASNNADVKRLGIVLSIGRCVGGLAALGWTIYAARELGADWGRLSTVLAYAAVAAVFTDLGIPLALTQLSCRHTQLDRAVVFRAMRRRAIVGSVAALALVFAWVNTSSAQGKWALAALYGISVTVNPVTGSFLALLRGRAIGKIEACYEAGRQLALPIIGIAIVEAGLGVFAVLAVYVVIDVVGAMLVYRTARTKLGIVAEPKTDEVEAKELTLRQTVPLSSTTIVGNAYERVDSALLAPLAGLASVGIYRMISPIVGAALMPARGFGDAAAVGAGRTDKDNLRGFVTKFAVKGAMITVPVAIILAIIGPVILPKILSTHSSDPAHAINWNEAATPLRILLLTAIPSAILATLTPVAVIANRDRVFRFALGALAANIVLNLVLVPSWGLDLGITGAALAFLTTETVLCAVLWATLPSARAPAVKPVAAENTATDTAPPSPQHAQLH
jgi:O-antigen/teichoic acid export membrane protein